MHHFTIEFGKMPHISTCNFELTLFMLLFDEVIPVIRVLFLNEEPINARTNDR